MVEPLLNAPEDPDEGIPEFFKPKGSDDDLRQTARSGQFWAWLGIIRMFIIYFAYPILCFRTAKCVNGFPTSVGTLEDVFPGFLLWGFATCIPIQIFAARAVVRGQIRALPEIVGGTFPIPYSFLARRLFGNRITKKGVFWIWFISINLISGFANQMGFVWNAEVLGMVYASSTKEKAHFLGFEREACPDSISKVWSSVMKGSVLWGKLENSLFGWNPAQDTFQYYIGVVYALTSIQLFFALAVSIRGPNRYGKVLPPEGQAGSDTLQKKTLYEFSGTNNLQQLLLQAEMGRVDAATDLHTPWVERKIEEKYRKLQEYSETDLGVDAALQNYKKFYNVKDATIAQLQDSKPGVSGWGRYRLDNVVTYKVPTGQIVVFVLFKGRLNYYVNGDAEVNDVTELNITERSVVIRGSSGGTWDSVRSTGCQLTEGKVMRDNLGKIEKLFAKSQERTGHETEYLYLLVSQMQRVIAKFLVVGILQNVATANVQCTLYAMYVLMQKGSFFKKGELYTQQWPVFFNLVMCLVGTLLALGDIFNLKKIFKMFLDHTPDLKNVRGICWWRRFMLLILFSYLPECVNYSVVQRLRSRVWRLLLRFVLYMVIYFVVTAWTITKFVSIWACESSLFNVGTGCVPCDEIDGLPC